MEQNELGSLVEIKSKIKFLEDRVLKKLSTLFEAKTIDLARKVFIIDGIFELPMIGSEIFLIKSEAQNFSAAPVLVIEKNHFGPEGVFVERNGIIYQIQERLGDYDSTLEDHPVGFEKDDFYLEKEPDFERYYNDFYPAARLPEESILIVRIEELERFGMLSSETDKSKENYSQKPNGHTERHAAKREQILGAALHAMSHWPDECKNKQGKIEASKIAKCIEDHSAFLFPDTGASPLSQDQMTRNISNWINSRR